MTRKKKSNTDDVFDQKALDRLHGICRDVMGIGHLAGEMLLVDKVDKKGSLGNALSQYGRNWYTIKILNPDMIPPGNNDSDILDTCIHECLHIKFWWLTKMKLSRVEQEHHEAMINDLAGIITRLYRGQ
jgi:hypothetical protein